MVTQETGCRKSFGVWLSIGMSTFGADGAAIASDMGRVFSSASATMSSSGFATSACRAGPLGTKSERDDVIVDGWLKRQGMLTSGGVTSFKSTITHNACTNTGWRQYRVTSPTATANTVA